MRDIKYIASVSFGKDSLAMLLRLLKGRHPLDAVVFYDTGMEFQSIYNIRDRLRPILQENGVEYIELRPKEPFLYSMLEREVKYREKPGYHYGYGWCGGGCRWATRNKTASINRFKKNQMDTVIDYVGIACDELHRAEKNADPNKRFPLIEWGMSEADCLSYCHDAGFRWMEGDIELYDILDRVSCWCCKNKNLKELRNIYQYLPDYWQRLRDLQSKIPMPMKGEGKSIFDLEKRFSSELGNGDIKEEIFNGN